MQLLHTKKLLKNIIKNSVIMMSSVLDRLHYWFDKIPIPNEVNTCVCGCTELVELHHLIPQSTGGTKWHEVPLCPTCHSQSARASSRANVEKFQDKQKSYLTAEEIHTLGPIVNIAVLAKTYNDNGEDHWQHVAIKSITAGKFLPHSWTGWSFKKWAGVYINGCVHERTH